jgi:vitamin-K-epoxide reductase (warfarin-sensitive)
MRFVLALLALLGIVASALALREHYRTDISPCSINERWDCGIVNHSPYAVLWGVPVATIGIAGYLLLGILALKRWYLALLPLSLGALAFSLYLAHIEAHLLGVWCVYCVASLVVISAFSQLALGTVLLRSRSRKAPA